MSVTFPDQPEQLFPFKQSPPDPVNLPLLVNGVDIEQQYDRYQPANRLREKYPRQFVLMLGQFGSLLHYSHGQQQRHDDRHQP